MSKGTIFDIKKFSIHDGPGIRTTIFLKGCPLRCLWCHNPEGLSPTPEIMVWKNRCIHCEACLEACPQGALSANNSLISHDEARCIHCGACVEACYAEARQWVGREMTVDQVLAALERDRPFYDESGGGVTFSGGEPTLQAAFLFEILRACREREIHTAVETCGFTAWDTLDRVREYTDLFLYDVKLMDSTRHKQCTGVPNERILSNLRALSERGHAIILRLPLIPGINDDEENVSRTGAFAAALPHLMHVEVLPYHGMAREKYLRHNVAYTLTGTRAPSTESVTGIVQKLEAFGLTVIVDGKVQKSY